MERLARRLEQAAQDKARMLRKIEAIEQSVERTNEAIRTGALVPAGQPSRSIFVAEPSNQNAFWWQRAVRVNTTALVGVLALTILALISSMPDVNGKMIPMLYMAGSALPFISSLFVVIIFAGLFTTAAPLLWIVLMRFAKNDSKS